MVNLKTTEEIKLIKESSKIVAIVLNELKKIAVEGISTAKLDSIAEEIIRDYGGIPSFKGYNGYPKSTCISINNEIVHGIPGKRVLCDGDLVSIDVGVYKNGFHGDAAITIGIGNISDERKKLIEVTKEALMCGIEKAHAGNKLGDISYAIEKKATENGFSVVRNMVGHGIGRNLHEEPEVPNFGKPNKGLLLQVGLVIAIEPMINMGSYKTVTLDDGWTVVTADGKDSAHFEHTIAITENGPKILTTLL